MSHYIKKKSLPKSKGYYIFLFIIMVTTFITISIIIELISNSNSSANTRQWNIASINEFLGVSIPSVATYVEYTGHKERGGRLNLSFEADSEEATEFVSMLCMNILYQGYDPFNAIDISEPIDNAHLIEIGNVSYYSYSINTPQSTYGTRCFSYEIGQIQAVLDKSDVDKSFIKLEVLFNCSKCKIP